jgi:hypothetical protein
MSIQNITSESIDRLVDGELSPTQRRELLLRLEEVDGGWRRCALAFLEAQAWGRELRSVVASPPATATLAKTQNRAFPWRTAQWAVLAASLMVAFWLGGRTNSRTEKPLIAGNTPNGVALPPPAEVRPSEPINPGDVMTVWARDAQGVAQPLHIPLVDADTVDKHLGVEFRSGMSPELKQKLEDRGYQVESRQRYAPLWLEQGQPLMLPVEDTRIVPAGRDIL